MAQVWHVLLYCKILKVCEIGTKRLINSLPGASHQSLLMQYNQGLAVLQLSLILLFDTQKDEN